MKGSQVWFLAPRLSLQNWQVKSESFVKNWDQLTQLFEEQQTRNPNTLFLSVEKHFFEPENKYNRLVAAYILGTRSPVATLTRIVTI